MAGLDGFVGLIVIETGVIVKVDIRSLLLFCRKVEPLFYKAIIMLNFVERDDNPFEYLDTLPRVLTVDRVETNLFRSRDDLTEQLGSWGRFFAHIYGMNIMDDLRNCLHTEGEVCGLKWTKGVAAMPVECSGNIHRGRFARWLKIKMGNENLVAVFHPWAYYQPNGYGYVDHRFVVASSSENLPTLAILFADEIMMETEWTSRSRKSKNMV
jgi:hypothetical protein